MNEKFTKIDKDTYKRIQNIEQEDVFKIAHLEQEKRDLEMVMAAPQKKLDEINHILEEVKKIK